MELKFLCNHGDGNKEHGSNRTFMELKLLLRLGSHKGYTRSNRTFMELKFPYNNKVTRG